MVNLDIFNIETIRGQGKRLTNDQFDDFSTTMFLNDSHHHLFSILKSFPWLLAEKSWLKDYPGYSTSICRKEQTQ